MEFIVQYFESLLSPAQIVGVVALVMSIVSFQQNIPRRIIICQLIANTLFTVHFFMLGAITGAVINLMSAVRSLIYAQTDKKWAMHPFWTGFFVVVSIAVGIWSWEGLKSILPVLGSVCFTISFRMKTAKMVRIVSFPSSPLWIVYNIINGSYAGVFTEVYVMISIIIGMIRFDIRKAEE